MPTASRSTLNATRETQIVNLASSKHAARMSDPHATISTRPKREQGPHQNVKTSAWS